MRGGQERVLDTYGGPPTSTRARGHNGTFM